jgi:hypothetical protein
MNPRTLLPCALLLALAPAAAGSERDVLLKRIGDLEQKVEQLTRELNQQRAEAVRADVEARAEKARNEQMAAALEEAWRQVEARGGKRPMGPALARRIVVGGGAAVPLQPAVLPAAVRGKVTGVSDQGLVQISVGSDGGLTTGHTLDVYRIDPDNPRASQYLGKVTLLRVEAKAAVGRFTEAARGRKAAVGDDVATGLNQTNQR